MIVSNTKTTEYTVLSWEIILPYKTWFIPELEGIKCLQPERVLIISPIKWGNETAHEQINVWPIHQECPDGYFCHP